MIMTQVNNDIRDLERKLSLLRKAIIEKDLPLKVAQTRLDERTRRMNLELTHDEPMQGLVMCQSLSVTRLYCAKTAERTEVPFGLETCSWGPIHIVLDGGSNVPVRLGEREWGNFSDCKLSVRIFRLIRHMTPLARVVLLFAVSI